MHEIIFSVPGEVMGICISEERRYLINNNRKNIRR